MGRDTSTWRQIDGAANRQGQGWMMQPRYGKFTDTAGVGSLNGALFAGFGRRVDPR